MSSINNERRNEIMQGVYRFATLLAVVLVVLGIHWFVTRPHIRGGDGGPLQTSCRKTPAFATKVGVTQPVFDTSQKGVTGLTVYDSQHPDKVFQPPSWKIGGNLGPLAIDDAGNTYAAPVPNINTLDNPPAKQNTIYFVDTATAVMTEYYSLKDVAIPNQTNPYGLLSLAFDCETKVLYASTISGSTPTKTNGSIVAIDTANKREISRVTGVDALSVGLFRDSKGAQLYYGLAGRSEVWRVGLAGNGTFVGQSAFSFSYDPYNELKPRKLDFNGGKSLQVHTTEFRYNLIASTEFRQENINYTYDAASDHWNRVPTPAL